MEITPFQYEYTIKKIQEKFSCVGTLRPASKGESKPFITDNGNYIVDCVFKDGMASEMLVNLAAELKAMTGVIDHGLFLNMANSVIVATSKGTINVMLPPASG